MATYKQLVKPDRKIVGRVGWCLQYVRQVFGRPAVEPTAKQGWDRAKYKHKNRSHPKNVCMPLWWDFTDPKDGINYGHVVWYDTDGTYNSSPFDTTTGWYIGKSIDDITRQLQRFGKAKYLGWSEDISGKRVIEPVKETKPKGDIMKTDLTSAQWRQFVEKVYLGFNGKKPSKSEADFHLKNSNPLSFVNGFASFKWQSLEKDVTSLKKDKTALAKDKTALQTQVKDLNTALKKAQAQLDKDSNHVPADMQKEIERLTAENAKLIQQAQSTTDEINNTYTLIGGWLAKVIALFKRVQ